MIDQNDEFYANESKELREKYQRAQEGSGQLYKLFQANNESDPKKDRAQRLLLFIMILYSIILITFVLLLYWVRDFRYFCFNVLNDFNEQGQFLGALYIGLIGLWFVLTGFNVVLYDILAGFLIQPYWFALLTVSVGKFLAKILDWKILDQRFHLYSNERQSLFYYMLFGYGTQTCEVPTIFKTYACGLFRITHFQYIHPTIFGTVVWAGFWVYMGAHLESLSDLLQTGDTSSYVPIWLKILMVMIIAGIIFYFLRLTNQIYIEIQHDANITDLSHIIEREEEEEKLVAEHNNSIGYQRQQEITDQAT